MFEKHTPRGLTVLAAFVSVLAVSQAGRAQNQDKPRRLSVPEALATYERKTDGDVAKRLVGQRDAIDLLRRYRSEAEHWIKTADATERAHRERVAVGLAMELVAAELDGAWVDYLETRPLIEWACERFAKGVVSEFERMAYLASIAMLQGAGDYSLFGIIDGPYKKPGHLEHALRRFPADDRLRLAHVLARPEVRVIAPARLEAVALLPAFMSRPTAEDGARRLDETIFLLTSLEGPSVRDEARLRRGVLEFLVGRSPEASQDLEAASASPVPFIAYLANVVLGSLYHGTGEGTAAIARFSRAVRIQPATSARLGLAAALLKQGHAREAAEESASLLSSRRVDDPWRIYGLGLFHELPAYLAAMRTEIR